MNASSPTPTRRPKVDNLEETVTLALVTAPPGASYNFINSAGDIGTWVNTDLDEADERPVEHVEQRQFGRHVVVRSDVHAAAGVDNANGHATKGFWSGDSGNSWSTFASLPTGAAASQSNVGNLIVCPATT